MKLYIYDHCPFCCRARMIFGLKEMPVETQVVMEGDAETPVRLVGRKVLPILRRDDGSHMAESMDIVHHIDHQDGAPLLTQSSDDRIATWHEKLWPVALKLFIPRFTRADFPEIATGEAREAYRRREEEAFGDLDALIVRTPVLIGQVNDALAALEPILTERTAIDSDDFLLYPLLRSLSIVRSLRPGPVTRAYMERMATKTGVALLVDQAT